MFIQRILRCLFERADTTDSTSSCRQVIIAIIEALELYNETYAFSPLMK